jgi:hypothetical protein
MVPILPRAGAHTRLRGRRRSGDWAGPIENTRQNTPATNPTICAARGAFVWFVDKEKGGRSAARLRLQRFLRLNPVLMGPGLGFAKPG